MYKYNYELTAEEKVRIEKMCGRIMVWLIEKRSLFYMAEQLKMEPWKLEYNMDEMLYQLRKHVGWRRYLRVLFMK